MRTFLILSVALLFWPTNNMLACGSVDDIEEYAEDGEAVAHPVIGWIDNPAHRDSPLLRAIALRDQARLEGILTERNAAGATLTEAEAEAIIELGVNIRPAIFTALIRHEFGVIPRLREIAVGAEDYLYNMLEWVLMGEYRAAIQLLAANGVRPATLAINAAQAGDIALLLSLSFSGLNIATLEQGDQRPLTILRESDEDDLRTYLFFEAIQQGHLRRVQDMERGFQTIVTRPINGVSALHWAAFRYHENVFRFLMDTHLDVNGVDNRGMTPLMYAARFGHRDLVRTLLQNPAVNLDAADNEGLTAGDWAARTNHGEIQADIDAAPEIRALAGHGTGDTEEPPSMTRAGVDALVQAAGGCG